MPASTPWAAGLSERDEHELLALVEGRLTPDQERAAIVRWQSRPEVIRFVESAIGDRVSLSSVAEVPCPAGLLEGVEAVLEHHMLLGSEGDASFSSGVESGVLVSPGPAVYVPPSSGVSRFWTGGRLAVAAALLIVAGSAAFLSMRPGTSSTGGYPGSSPDESARFARHADAGPSIASKVGIETNESIAPAMAGGDAGREVSADSAATLAASPGPDSQVPPGSVLAMHDAPMNIAPMEVSSPIDAERAVELAREGRLMVRVVTGSVTASMDRLRDGRERRLFEFASAVNTTPPAQAR
ncbi:MAG TPA: hypothetical protein PKU91_11110, partial [Phycisphaerales bacterium]|nr:hypothetical protein [Phycisphaerales bacterium]